MLWLIASILISFSFLVSSVYAENGEIFWKEELVSLNSFVDVYVVDDDMNLKEYPNWADSFIITVWSDYNTTPIELEVVETGIFTGKFKGRIYISDTGDPTVRLIANQGDMIYAEYIDESILDGNQKITSVAVVKIPRQDMNIYLEKIDPSMKKNISSQVPEWVKNNAGWWSEGQIDENSFIQGIQFLIKEKIISIPQTKITQTSSEGIPEWVKNNAGWWASNKISETEFLAAIVHLVKTGIISIEKTEFSNVEQKDLDSDEFEECQEITSAYKRLNCEKGMKDKILLSEYIEKSKAQTFGPITFYYPGIGQLGNEFEVSSSGQAILTLKILALNTGSSDNITLFCSGPSICNYDVWNGKKAFKYSSSDFVSGQITLKEGQHRVISMLFGPNIGYGGTEFEFNESEEYFFRVSEPWGSGEIPLHIR